MTAVVISVVAYVLMGTPLCKTLVAFAPAYNIGCSPNNTGCKLNPVSLGLFHPAPVTSHHVA